LIFSKSRRHARELALRVLYESEYGDRPAAEILAEAFTEVPQVTAGVVEPSLLYNPDDDGYWTQLEYGFNPELERYTEELVYGVQNQQARINELIQDHLHDYELGRLAAMDRIVMQIATFELLYVPYISPFITINEAIEIAKKFSSVESGKFVNGVLGNLYKVTEKHHWDPKMGEAEPEVYVAPVLKEELVEEVVDADSQEGKNARRFGWVLKTDLMPEPAKPSE